MTRKKTAIAAKQSSKRATKSPAKKRAQPAALDPVHLVMELMAIPGKSGEEGAVMEYLRQQLVAAGAEEEMLRRDNAHQKSDLAGEAGNLFLKLPGNVKGPRRLLSAHVDTVPICVGCQPVRKGEVIESALPTTGLGADDRAGTAVLLATALRLLRDQPPHYPVTFLWTVQEEVGLFGARHANLRHLGRPALAFNFDGGNATKLTVGATGGYRMKVELTGIASHAGGAPEEGVSAIAIASLAIADLVEQGWHGRIDKGGCQGTSNVGIIRGGNATNVVTNYVELRAEARSHDATFRQRIVREIEQAFERAVERVRNVHGQGGGVEFTGRLDYESFRLPPNDPSVLAARHAVHQEGQEAEIAVANGGLDANWLTARGVPTVSLGCGQRNIHTANEQLDVAEFELACHLARRLVVAEEESEES